MRVTPPPAAVPRCMVANSRMVLSSPMMSWVSSPLNFKSWGISPSTANWKMRQRLPMLVKSRIIAWGPIWVWGPMATRPSMML